ncbi:Uncharacterised protein [Burkholderia pseudomallei]|nr:Uncharacterised protein [Burkholderia pseudomallei]
MGTCAHSNLELSLDRWQECHWYLHQMESNYHEPEPFRYSCNSFLRAVKEVPLALTNDLQRHPNERAKIKPFLESTSANILLQTLGKRRDFVVHHGALNLKSYGRIGTTEGAQLRSLSPSPSVRRRRLMKRMSDTRLCVRPTRFFGGSVRIAILRLHCGARG